MDATASACALTASLQTFRICRIAFTRLAGVTIAGHFVTGYRRPRDLRLPAPRLQDLLPPSRARPLQAAFYSVITRRLTSSSSIESLAPNRLMHFITTRCTDRRIEHLHPTFRKKSPVP